jgi:hypothetical protein
LPPPSSECVLPGAQTKTAPSPGKRRLFFSRRQENRLTGIERRRPVGKIFKMCIAKIYNTYILFFELKENRLPEQAE